MFFKLTGDSVNVYYVLISEDYPGIIASKQWGDLLDEDEEKTLSRFKGAIRKREFVLGRILIKIALADYLKIPAPEIRLGKNQYGKLYLDDSNLGNHPPVFFNLSHSGNIVACSVALNHEMGIDVENKRRAFKRVGLSFFHPKEIKYIERAPLESRGEIACRLWTLKEAYVKAKGMGLFIPLSDFNVLEEETIFFHSAIIENDYYLSVAVENPNQARFQVQMRKINLSWLWFPAKG